MSDERDMRLETDDKEEPEVEAHNRANPDVRLARANPDVRLADDDDDGDDVEAHSKLHPRNAAP